MTGDEFAAWLRRLEQAPAPRDLVDCAKELAALPVSRERDALQGMIRAMIIRRAGES